MMPIPKLNAIAKHTFANKTIQELAQQARNKIIAEIGERAFARVCLDFDANIIPNYRGTPNFQYIQVHLDPATQAWELLVAKAYGVISFLENTSQPYDWQLALIWLDDAGWGHIALKYLLSPNPIIRNAEISYLY
jgi:hypothetical protein